MNKLTKTILITGVAIVVLGILVFISQMIWGRSTLEQKRQSIINTVNMDTARFAVYSKTDEYKRLFLTKSRDSLDMFLNNYINTRPR
jgi:hypothetical protein